MITPEQIAKSGSEHAEQSALFQQAALHFNKYPQLRFMYAVSNGFFASAGQKAKMKAEGLRDGVPDICLPFKKLFWGALYIELKIEKRRKEKNGGCSEDQLKYLDYLNEAGYKAVVCYSWQEAWKVIEEYLA